MMFPRLPRVFLAVLIFGIALTAADGNADEHSLTDKIIEVPPKDFWDCHEKYGGSTMARTLCSWWKQDILCKQISDEKACSLSLRWRGFL
jgi:hypothetical protein